MLDILKAIIIGIVEGITEFLPISSTGHIDLVSQFVKINQNADFMSMFEYVIQFGAILAVIILYFNKLNPFSPKKTTTEKSQTWSLWFKVAIACLPSVIIGLPLNDWMDEHLHTPLVVASMLILYGILFIVIENLYRNKKPQFINFSSIGYKTALFIGAFQALSIVPGTSRSGATILGAIILGASRYIATEFSFFLAIPTMFGVSILKIGKFLLKGNTFTGEQMLILATGTIVSFVVAIITIKWLMKFVQSHDFKPFGWYRIILGAIVLMTLFIQH
ncbi:undecaprenyl-diphosphate phosphatase [Convivina intestini]|uniref:undecaprenyl-diphosphate phosphatase n=1 Tax=Convivina intestini TaxID=1505726 RepID=UPI002010315E|nr:undecaprenyl-diphosphate phosphatase [Convivina intestini]CAH1851785.1 Undecaprenyl-diphosphatase [Convivina intestini]